MFRKETANSDSFAMQAAFSLRKYRVFLSYCTLPILQFDEQTNQISVDQYCRIAGFCHLLPALNNEWGLILMSVEYH